MKPEDFIRSSGLQGDDKKGKCINLDEDESDVEDWRLVSDDGDYYGMEDDEIGSDEKHLDDKINPVEEKDDLIVLAKEN